jgi:hypothetical protein
MRAIIDARASMIGRRVDVRVLEEKFIADSRPAGAAG